MKLKKQQLRKDFKTPAPVTWCPGCLNNSTLLALQRALAELVREKELEAKNIVLVTDIGCGAKAYDFLAVNAFYSLHGRVLPTALGIKTANSGLTVVGIGGDGGTYSEGIAHLVHACRFNVDMTMIVANNGVFALTKGQVTPTTRDLKRREQDSLFGSRGLNPLVLTLASGASLVARGSALDPNHLSQLIKTAIRHKGFSFIDVLQPCLVFHNDVEYLRKHAYYLKRPLGFKQAFDKAREWDYGNTPARRAVPLGIFYKFRRKTWEEKLALMRQAG